MTDSVLSKVISPPYLNLLKEILWQLRRRNHGNAKLTTRTSHHILQLGCSAESIPFVPFHQLAAPVIVGYKKSEVTPSNGMDGRYYLQSQFADGTLPIFLLHKHVYYGSSADPAQGKLRNAVHIRHRLLDWRCRRTTDRCDAEAGNLLLPQ